MIRLRFAAALVLALLCGAFAHALDPTSTPTSPRGTLATIDLPPELHIRNRGGSDRAGLCVGTSVQVAARWHGLTQMEGFQDWLARRPGGSWPQKLASDLKAFAKAKGITLPRFVQHTGGDPQFLELVYRTRRMPAHTWTAAHMVSGAHLDRNQAAVIDNNRPGKWLWQTHDEYLRAWEASGPGWVFCWLAPPPPPGKGGAAPVPLAPIDPAPFSPTCPGPSCPRPSQPVPFSPSCPGPNCPRWQRVELAGGEVLHKLFDADGSLLGVLKADGWHIAHGDGWVAEPGGDVPDDAPPIDSTGGIDVTQLDRTRPRYWVDGVEVTQAEAFSAVTGADVLADDSGNYHLSFVTDGEVPQVLTDARLAPLLAKCHVQVYRPDSWVARQRLSSKVTLHEPAPKGGRVIGEGNSLELEVLLALLRPFLDPTWVPPAPPKPDPAPTPVTPAKPDQQPTVEPAPTSPATPQQPFPWLTIAAAIAAAFAVRPTNRSE